MVTRILNIINKTHLLKLHKPPLLYRRSFFNNNNNIINNNNNNNNNNKRHKKDNLIIDIINDPTNQYLYLKLSNLMNNMTEDTVEIFKENNTTDIQEQKPEKFKKIDLILMTLHLQNNNKEALKLLINYMYENEISFIKMRDGKIESFDELVILNYELSLFDDILKPNSDEKFEISNLIKLMKVIKPKQKIKLSTTCVGGDQSVHIGDCGVGPIFINRISILMDYLHYYTTMYKYDIYFYLSESLTNNFETVEISTLKNSSFAYYSKIENKTRLELLKEIIENQSNLKFIKLNKVYHHLGNCLDTKLDKIEINENGEIKEYDKLSLFEKAIELGGSLNLDLANCMKNKDEYITISFSQGKGEKKQYSKFDILKEIAIGNDKNQRFNLFIDDSNTLILQTNQQNKCEFEKYKQLFEKELMEKRKMLIEYLEIDSTNSWLYKELIQTFKDKSNEKIKLLNGKMVGKIDLLLKLIDLYPNTPNVYYELSKQLDEKSQGCFPSITFLNGDKNLIYDLLIFEIEMKYTPSINGMVYLKYSKLIDCCDFDSQSYYLTKAITLNPKLSEAYFKLGFLLYENEINEFTFQKSNIDLQNENNNYINTNFTMNRKEIILKSLHLEDSTDPINSKNELALYYLAQDMDENEIQFGKNKMEILKDNINNY